MIRGIRTHLDLFTEVECQALMYDGYSMTDAILWAHRLTCPDAYRAPELPRPAWRIEFTSEVIREWTRGLTRSGVLFARR
jgi:hypothetical protein